MENSLHTITFSVAEKYNFENILQRTLSSELIKVTDFETLQGGVLWCGLQRITDPQAQLRIIERFQTLKRHSFHDKLVNFGVDREGILFLEFNSDLGYSLGTVCNNQQEGLRRFEFCLRSLSGVHKLGYCLGNIHHKTFAQTRDGGIYLTDVIGFPQGFSSQYLHGINPKRDADIELYLDPVLQETGRVIPQNDVFSLGVLGLALLMGSRFNADYKKQLMVNGDIKQLCYTELPAWFAKIISTATSLDPSLRYQNCGELLEAVNTAKQDLIQKGYALITAPIPKGNKSMQVLVAGGDILHDDEDLEYSPKQDKVYDDSTDLLGQELNNLRIKEEERALRMLQLKKGLVFGLVGVVALVVSVAAVSFISNVGYDKDKEEMINRLKANNSDVLVRELVSDDNKKKSEAIAELRNRQNGFLTILETLILADASNRSEFETALLDIVDEQKLSKTKTYLEQLFSRSKGQPFPTALKHLLMILDPEKSGASWEEAVYKSANGDSYSTIGLVALLFVDRYPDIEIRKILAEISNSDNSLAGLLKNKIINRAIWENRREIVKDLAWDDKIEILLHYQENRDPYVIDIFKDLIEDNNLTETQRLILNPVISNPSLLTDDYRKDTVLSLFKSLRGEFESIDIKNISFWQGNIDYVSLYTILMQLEDENLKNIFFSNLINRDYSSLENPVLNLVLQHIRDNPQIDKTRYLELVSLLILNKRNKAFDRFVLKEDISLVRELIKFDKLEVSTEILDAFLDKLLMKDLLLLLRSKHKDVRVRGINQLATYGDIGTLRNIADYYYIEKDPELRKLYLEKFPTLLKSKKRATGFDD